MYAEALYASSHSPSMTTAVPVRKHRHSSKMWRSSMKRRLNPTTEYATAVKKGENDLNATNAAESLHLLQEAGAAQEALLEAMRTVCCVYTEDFQKLHKTQKLQGCKDLGESVDFSLCNSPYNFCRRQDLQNSDHDVFNTNYTDLFCDFAEFVQMRRGHGLVFCFTIQFASWWQHFCACMEEVDEGDKKRRWLE